MASLNGYIDPDAGTPGTFEVFAAGPQMLEFTESDIAATNDGKGTLLKYRIRVTEGDDEDRLIFGNLMIQHKESGSNPKMATAVKMGQEAFKAARAVTGVSDEIDDTQDLHFKAFIGYVKVTPPKTGKDGVTYDAKNEVDWGKTYKYLTDGVTTVADAGQPVAANDNVAQPKAANDNKPAAAKAAPKGAPAKGAWPRKAA